MTLSMLYRSTEKGARWAMRHVVFIRGREGTFIQWDNAVLCLEVWLLHVGRNRKVLWTNFKGNIYALCNL